MVESENGDAASWPRDSGSLKLFSAASIRDETFGRQHWRILGPRKRGEGLGRCSRSRGSHVISPALEKSGPEEALPMRKSRYGSASHIVVTTSPFSWVETNTRALCNASVDEGAHSRGRETPFPVPPDSFPALAAPYGMTVGMTALVWNSSIYVGSLVLVAHSHPRPISALLPFRHLLLLVVHNMAKLRF